MADLGPDGPQGTTGGQNNGSRCSFEHYERFGGVCQKKIIVITLLGSLGYTESLRGNCNYFYQKKIYQNDI